MIKRTLLLAMALLPLSSHAQVYKCEVDGSTAYQDTPCPGGEAFATSGSLTVFEAHAPADPPPAQQRRRQPASQSRHSSSTNSYQSELEAKNARTHALAEGRIVEGMTQGQLYMMLGEPDSKRDYTRSNGDICERWFWKDSRFVPKDFYEAITCNGKVAR